MLRFPISLAIALLLLAIAIDVATAQYQKDYPPPSPESDQEPAGGYQAPPGTGRLAGPSQALSIEGLELEFPAFSLKLPRLTLPCLTTFQRPPRMLLDEAVAPYVRQYREEFSIESAPQRGPAAPESAGEPRQKSLDSKPYQQQAAPPTSDDNELTMRLREFEERERALAGRIDSLQRTIEQLVVGLEARQAAATMPLGTTQDLQPLPVVQECYPVRRTNYITASPDQPRLLRLPPVR